MEPVEEEAVSYESAYEHFVRTFLHVNHKVFNNLQRKLLRAVLDEDLTEDGLAEAIDTINKSIRLYEQAGWSPKKVTGDAVQRPQHYDVFPMEPTYFLIEVAAYRYLPWTIENFVKYICRYKFKNGVEDLKKSMRNLAMELRRRQGDPEWSL